MPGSAEAVSASAASAEDARTRWQQAQLTDYSFVLVARCGERALLGRYQVTVRAGEMWEVEGQGEYSRALVERDASLVPTIDELWDQVDRARAGDAEVVEVEVDESYGYPTSIAIDYSRAAVDDEICYEIDSFTVRE